MYAVTYYYRYPEDFYGYYYRYYYRYPEDFFKDIITDTITDILKIFKDIITDTNPPLRACLGKHASTDADTRRKGHTTRPMVEGQHAACPKE